MADAGAVRADAPVGPSAERWVLLLRGVNVGGVTVRSADLRACLEDAGLTRVRTVLASGNAVLDAGDDLDATRRRVERALQERFGAPVRTVLLPQDELADRAAAFPFAPREGWHDDVTFVLDPELLAGLAAGVDALGLDPRTDPVSVGEGVVYWQVEKGSSLVAPFARLVARTPFTAGTTTRNLRTVRRLTTG